ncbi:frataxin homolog, mitochondrial [Cimex lectularius]|uniref:ferroxidase n=1 Tax=Cimex lectularius TaxID=79782 RepID=A0A8I6R9T4_CIMLE|nr:frataxin homolog, mitochondrial [Cimex lectularius]
MWSRFVRYRTVLNVGKLLSGVSVRTRIVFTPETRYFRPSRRLLGTAQGEVNSVEFERVCNETLESLCDFFEVLVESREQLRGGDVTYSDGVLTVALGNNGTYVINRQTPNKQIWLSSPSSGPKRYDFDPQRNTWVYKHDNIPLHTLLKQELSIILNDNIDLSMCTYSEKTL